LYLGSFDPVHKAHIDIPLKIKDDYKLDQIIYVPTGKSPIGRRYGASSADRVVMLKNATKGYDFLSVSEFEICSENISFSIDTIKFFKRKYDNSYVRLILGEDNFVDFTSWREYKSILSVVNIIVLSRDNIDSYGKIKELDNYVVEDINLFNEARSEKIHYSLKYKSNVSATLVRESILHNKSIEDYVIKENYEYIQKNGLYK